MVHKWYKSITIITNIYPSRMDCWQGTTARACAASTRDFADLATRQYYKITTVGKCIWLNAFYFRVQDTDHISMVLLVQALVAPQPAFPARDVASRPRHTWPSTLLKSVTVVGKGQQNKLKSMEQKIFATSGRNSNFTPLEWNNYQPWISTSRTEHQIHY